MRRNLKLVLIQIVPGCYEENTCLSVCLVALTTRKVALAMSFCGTQCHKKEFAYVSIGETC